MKLVVLYILSLIISGLRTDPDDFFDGPKATAVINLEDACETASLAISKILGPGTTNQLNAELSFIWKYSKKIVSFNEAYCLGQLFARARIFRWSHCSGTCVIRGEDVNKILSLGQSHTVGEVL